MGQAKREPRHGAVVQISPHNRRFGGCFAIVDSVDAKGLHGHVRVPGESGRIAKVVLPDGMYSKIGKCAWHTSNELTDA